jgi:hypothetical protein
MSSSEEVLLRSIDAKLGAVLALTLDSYLRETGVARPKERSIDKILADSGVPPATIAELLGKTERAVYLQLAAAKSKKARRPSTARVEEAA